MGKDNIILFSTEKDPNKTYVNYKDKYFYTLSYNGFIPKSVIKTKLIREIDEHILLDNATTESNESNELMYTPNESNVDEHWVKFFIHILNMTFPIYDDNSKAIVSSSTLLSKHYIINKVPAKFGKDPEKLKCEKYTSLFNPLIREIRKKSLEELNLKLRNTLIYFLNIPDEYKNSNRTKYFRYSKATTLVTKYISHLKQIIYQIKTCNSDEFNRCKRNLNLNSYCMYFNNAPYLYFVYSIQHAPTLKTVIHKPFRCVYIFSTFKENVGKKPVHMILNDVGFRFPNTYQDMKNSNDEDIENSEEDDEDLDSNDDDTDLDDIDSNSDTDLDDTDSNDDTDLDDIDSNSDDENSDNDSDTDIVDLDVLNDVRRNNRVNRLTWRIFANMSGDNLSEYIQYPTLFFSIDKDLYQNLSITITEKDDVVMNISRRDPILTFMNVDNDNVVYLDIEGKDRQIRKVVDLFHSSE